MKYGPRTAVQIDYATGQKVCARCWADISHMFSTARYCSTTCRTRAKARRQRQEAKQRRRNELQR